MSTLPSSVFETPNFTIISPGTCNAHCPSCSWKQIETSERFVEMLHANIEILASQGFRQCSISGGEPTISPHFFSILSAVRGKFDKIVLHTNGAKLIDYISAMNDIIHFVNLYRHAIKDEDNYKVFGTNTVPDSDRLTEICELLNAAGIPVTLNFVMNYDSMNRDMLYHSIDYAKSIGVSSVCFRCVLSDEDLIGMKGHLPLPEGMDVYYDENRVFTYYEKIIRGMIVQVRISIAESSKKMEELYEVVMQPDGLLYRDWSFRHRFEMTDNRIKTDVLSRLKNGDCFTGKNGAFSGICSPRSVDEPKKILSVQLTKESSIWIEEWDLQHVIWGFEREDYQFI